MNTFTAEDMLYQVAESIDGWELSYDADAITAALISRYGVVNIDDIPSRDYWVTVAAHGK